MNSGNATSKQEVDDYTEALKQRHQRDLMIEQGVSICPGCGEPVGEMQVVQTVDWEWDLDLMRDVRASEMTKKYHVACATELEVDP